MASGGEFGHEAPELDYAIDNDEDDKQEINRTQTFEPTQASTPYYDWSKYEMQPMREKSGLLDPSYEETPLLSGSNIDADIERRLPALSHDPITGIIDTTHMMDTSINPLSPEDREKQIETVKKLIKDKYPNANFKNLPIAFSKKSPMDIVALGPKGGETKVVLNDGSGLQKRPTSKKALGPTGREIINQADVHIIKRQEELKKRKRK